MTAFLIHEKSDSVEEVLVGGSKAGGMMNDSDL
jgi:hypothetical protein